MLMQSAHTAVCRAGIAFTAGSAGNITNVTVWLSGGTGCTDAPCGVQLILGELSGSASPYPYTYKNSQSITLTLTNTWSEQTWATPGWPVDQGTSYGLFFAVNSPQKYNNVGLKSSATAAVSNGFVNLGQATNCAGATCTVDPTGVALMSFLLEPQPPPPPPSPPPPRYGRGCQPHMVAWHCDSWCCWRRRTQCALVPCECWVVACIPNGTFE